MGEKTYGGDGKIDFFRSGGSRLTERLNNLSLNVLIEEVAGVLSARYPKLRRIFDDGKESFIQISSPTDKENLRLLEDREWLRKTLDRHLKNTEWHKNGLLVAHNPPGIDARKDTYISKGVTESRLAMSRTSSDFDVDE